MTLAAIENADARELVDCSSIRFLTSNRLRFSMAASVTAHLALAVYLTTSLTPHGLKTASPVKSFNITLVDLDAPHPTRTIAQPVRHDQSAIPKTAPASEQTPATTEIKPPEAPRPAPIKLDANTKTLETSQPVSPEPRQQPASRIAADTADNPLPAGRIGARAASGSSSGKPDQADHMIINEARYRSPPKPPRYPKRARELNQQGEALLHIRLNPDGNAEEILVWRSSGYTLLDNAALAAARRWEFEPERRGGRAVIAWVKIPVRFSLH